MPRRSSKTNGTKGNGNRRLPKGKRTDPAMDALFLARWFIEKLGGVEKARAAVDAYATVLDSRSVKPVQLSLLPITESKTA